MRVSRNCYWLRAPGVPSAHSRSLSCRVQPLICHAASACATGWFGFLDTIGAAVTEGVAPRANTADVNSKATARVVSSAPSPRRLIFSATRSPPSAAARSRVHRRLRHHECIGDCNKCDVVHRLGRCQSGRSARPRLRNGGRRDGDGPGGQRSGKRGLHEGLDRRGQTLCDLGLTRSREVDAVSDLQRLLAGQPHILQRVFEGKTYG